MKALIWFTLWCILLCISWPLALVVLVGLVVLGLRLWKRRSAGT